MRSEALGGIAFRMLIPPNCNENRSRIARKLDRFIGPIMLAAAISRHWAIGAFPRRTQVLLNSLPVRPNSDDEAVPYCQYGLFLGKFSLSTAISLRKFHFGSP